MDHWMSEDRMAYITAIREKRASREIERIRTKLNGSDKNDPADALKFSILYNHSVYSHFILRKYGASALSDKHVCCPLIMLAVRLDHSDIVRSICKHSQCIDFTKLDHPFATDRIHYVDAPGCLAMEYRRTSLHIAILMGHEKSAEALIQYGADVNKKDSNGLAALELFSSKFPVQKDIGDDATVRSKKLCRLRCGAAILRMKKTITREMWNKLVEFYQEFNQLKLLDEFQPSGVPSLLHLSRIAVRNTIGPSRVPGGIDELEESIPRIMVEYLRFNEE